jgi:hypothetical protein
MTTKRSMKWTLLLACAAWVAPGCANIAGTDDLYLCETCPEGGGGAGGAGGTGGSGAGGCAPGQSEVDVTLLGGAQVLVVSTGQLLTASTSLCLADTEQELRAACADGENADVTWGNGACVDFQDHCKFTLSDDETFVVDAMDDCTD